MLTNILNTFFITIGCGTALAQPQKNRAINRDANSTNYTLNVNYGEMIEDSYTYDKNVFMYSPSITGTQNNMHSEERTTYTGVISNNYLRGKVRRMDLTSYQTNNYNGLYYDYSFIGVGTTNLDPIKGRIYTDTNTYNEINVCQQMIVIAVEGIGNQRNVNIDINQFMYGIIPYTEDFQYLTMGGDEIFKVYARVLSTNTNSLINITEQESSYFYKNGNLYDKQTELITGISGYQSTLQEYMMDVEIDNNLDMKIDSSIEVAIQNNITNYYLIYLEPRIIKNTPNLTNVLPVDRHQDLGNATDPPTPRYGIYGTNGSNLTIHGTDIVVSGSVEVIDVGGVMFQVLGMPFTFISTAFNLTLFAGTPYEINLSLLFLSIIAVLVFVFVIKIVVKLFAGNGG